jgi:hypothetical protein
MAESPPQQPPIEKIEEEFQQLEKDIQQILCELSGYRPKKSTLALFQSI